jgi:phage recombination protein Bet
MTPGQISLLKRTICKGSSDDELAFFLQQCQHLGLDPFSRQVYAVKRWDSAAKSEVMSLQISIDGMRSQAEASGEYRGQDSPLFCGEDGHWVEVWLKESPPLAAKVSIYREGFTVPVTAIAKYSSYVQTKKDGTPSRFWVTMPDVMLAKCAESLALRKAFPKQLSGVYSSDEMAQSQTITVEAISDREWASILARLGWTTAKLKETATANGLPTSSKDLTAEQSDQLFDAVLFRVGLESNQFKAAAHCQNSLNKLPVENLTDLERVDLWLAKIEEKKEPTPGLE